MNNSKAQNYELCSFKILRKKNQIRITAVKNDNLLNLKFEISKVFSNAKMFVNFEM